MLVLFCGLVLYRSCLNGYFLSDDFGYLRLYSSTSLSKFPELFATDWSQGIWGSDLQELRPLTGLTYWIGFRIWGTNPFGYHLESMLLHLLTLAGLYLLVVRTSRGLSNVHTPETLIRANAIISLLLFIVHPAQVDAVAWIAGRTDLLGAVTYIWSMVCLVDYWMKPRPLKAVAGIAIYTAGVFMKENVVTLPAAFLLYVVLTGRIRDRWRAVLMVIIPLGLVALLWLVLRWTAFGSVGRSANLEGAGAFLTRLPFYADQGLPSLPEASLILIPAFLLCSLIYGVAEWRRSGGMILYWGVGWTVLHMVPLVAVSYESPRHIFMALAGPLVALSSAATLLWHDRRLVPAAALALTLVLGYAFVPRTLDRLAAWEQSSRYSRQLSQLLSTADYAAGSIVVVNSSPPVPVFFWNWALPFAVEPPFMNFRARIVAPAEWYCCPQSLAGRDAIFNEITAGADLRVHIVDFNAVTDSFETQ
jgi:energy-coupling factor transporter transmembrane protein EcfT